MRSGLSSGSCSTSTLKKRSVRLIGCRVSNLYTRGMACALCETRRPRRYCPGVRGEICTTCCGTEREMTVDCPPDCEFLLEARKHDKPVPLDAGSVLNQGIRVTEEFVAENEELALHLADARSEERRVGTEWN